MTRVPCKILHIRAAPDIARVYSGVTCVGSGRSLRCGIIARPNYPGTYRNEVSLEALASVLARAGHVAIRIVTHHSSSTRGCRPNRQKSASQSCQPRIMYVWLALLPSAQLPGTWHLLPAVRSGREVGRCGWAVLRCLKTAKAGRSERQTQEPCLQQGRLVVLGWRCVLRRSR